MIDGTPESSVRKPEDRVRKPTRKPKARELKEELLRRLTRVVRQFKVGQVRELLELTPEELVDLLEQRPSSVGHLASPGVAAQNRDLMS